jgi:hypothetical protein
MEANPIAKERPAGDRDVGLLQKLNRGDQTAIELFFREVACGRDKISRLLDIAGEMSLVSRMLQATSGWCHDSRHSR